MGVSHMIVATDDKGNEGLMLDVDGDEGHETFTISLGKWNTGMRSFGFNAEVSNLTREEFSAMVDKLVELKNKYGV